MLDVIRQLNQAYSIILRLNLKKKQHLDNILQTMHSCTHNESLISFFEDEICYCYQSSSNTTTLSFDTPNRQQLNLKRLSDSAQPSAPHHKINLLFLFLSLSLFLFLFLLMVQQVQRKKIFIRYAYGFHTMRSTI